jgi:hypothetical protein
MYTWGQKTVIKYGHKLPVEKRICPLCNIEPEDEIHFILKCPKLDECRKELFANISSVVPSFNDMDEFKFILSSNDLDICTIHVQRRCYHS